MYYIPNGGASAGPLGFTVIGFWRDLVGWDAVAPQPLSDQLADALAASVAVIKLMFNGVEQLVTHRDGYILGLAWHVAILALDGISCVGLLNLSLNQEWYVAIIVCWYVEIMQKYYITGV